VIFTPLLAETLRGRSNKFPPWQELNDDARRAFVLSLVISGRSAFLQLTGNVENDFAVVLLYRCFDGQGKQGMSETISRPNVSEVSRFSKR